MCLINFFGSCHYTVSVMSALYVVQDTCWCTLTLLPHFKVLVRIEPPIRHHFDDPMPPRQVDRSRQKLINTEINKYFTLIVP